MDSIQSSLNKWKQENTNFNEQHAKMKQAILNDPQIKQFLDAHPELSQKIIDKNLVKLYEYMNQSKQCGHCSSLKNCKNVLQGYSPLLSVEHGDIHLSYEKCQQKLNAEVHSEQQKMIESLYMPKEILNASVGNIHDDPQRSSAIRQLFNFLRQAESGLPEKGIYFYGPFGVGKTYFLGALANKLKEYQMSSMLIYMPEFVREIKNSFKDDSVNEKINYFKHADVLMLDDIGAETQSAWFRDEVLGSILQYRMMEKLPVFFTSNYSIEQLEEQLAITTRGGIEQVKAGRIIERIKQVSLAVEIHGPNKRE